MIVELKPLKRIVKAHAIMSRLLRFAPSAASSGCYCSPCANIPRMRSRALFSAICLGITALVTQILLLREFISVFSGNELVIGIVLGNWLLLTGLGSLCGKLSGSFKKPLFWIIGLQTTLAVLPLLEILGVRTLRLLFVPGIALGPNEAFLFSLLLLLPFCFASGFLLTLLSKAASDQARNSQIGDVYVSDTLGGIIGGALFSFFLVYCLAPLQICSLLFALNLLSALKTLSPTPISRRLILASILAMLSLLLFLEPRLNRLTLEIMFPGQRIISELSTPYGNLIVVSKESQINVFENGIPTGSNLEPLAAEETVHYGLSQHREPKTVLLVSGSLIGTHLEALKYNTVEEIHSVELDPAVIDLAKVINPTKDSRVKFFTVDARRFIRSAQNRYDAILISLPDPSSAQLNRYYTVEFFREARLALKSNGILSVGLSTATNYANPEIRLLSSSIYRSISQVFKHSVIIPGNKQFFIASDKPLRRDIEKQLDNKGVETVYVHQDFLAARLTPDRLLAAKDNSSLVAPINRDLFPTCYYTHLKHWLRQTGGNLLIPCLALTAVILGIIWLANISPSPAVSIALSASGFSSLGLEIVLILSFQSLYGYAYQHIAVMITAFLVGASLGAWWSNKKAVSAEKLFQQLDMLIAVTACFLPFALTQMGSLQESSLLQHCLPSVFPALVALVGFLSGAQFPLASFITHTKVEKTAAELYAIDFLGACLGALLIGAFFVPILGIPNTCILIGGIKTLTALWLWLLKRTLARQGVSSENALRASPIFPLISIATSLALSWAIANGRSNKWLFSLSLIKPFHLALLLLLAWGIIRAIRLVGGKKAACSDLTRIDSAFQAKSGFSLFRWINYLSFGLVVFYPIVRCYFFVPYIFCHVCPKKCVFGILRPYLIPAALIMNLEKRFWCFHACPIGTLHDCQAKISSARRRIIGAFRLLGTAAIIFTAIAYFAIKEHREHPPGLGFDWHAFFFAHTFEIRTWSLVVFGTLFIISFFVRRSFCDTLCPAGNLSEMILKMGRKSKSD